MQHGPQPKHSGSVKITERSTPATRLFNVYTTIGAPAGKTVGATLLNAEQVEDYFANIAGANIFADDLVNKPVGSCLNWRERRDKKVAGRGGWDETTIVCVGLVEG